MKIYYGHLWHLSPEASALYFFDIRVTVDTKIKI